MIKVPLNTHMWTATTKTATPHRLSDVMWWWRHIATHLKNDAIQKTTRKRNSNDRQRKKPAHTKIGQKVKSNLITIDSLCHHLFSLRFFQIFYVFFLVFFSHPFLRFGALALFNRLSCSHTQTHNDKLGGTCPLPCMQKWNFAIRSRREAIKQLALSLCRWWRRTMMLSLCVVHLIRGFQAIQLKTNASLASHVSFSFALQIHFKMA